MNEDAVSTVKRFYGRYAVGDVQGVVALTAPDADWFFPGDPSVLPWGGRWPGTRVKAVLDTLYDTLDYLEVEIRQIVGTEEPGLVLVRTFERCRVKATGAVFENEIVAMVRVRDERVVEHVEFSDTAAMQRCFA